MKIPNNKETSDLIEKELWATLMKYSGKQLDDKTFRKIVKDTKNILTNGIKFKIDMSYSETNPNKFDIKITPYFKI